MEKRTLKYYLDNRNFTRISHKKQRAPKDKLKIVDDQIVYNSIEPHDLEEEIVTSYTYLSKKGISKKWTDEETALFYRALECCGYDFSLMNTLFPGRSRNNLKQKYKKELKNNQLKVETTLKRFKQLNLDKFNELKKELKIDTSTDF